MGGITLETFEVLQFSTNGGVWLYVTAVIVNTHTHPDIYICSRQDCTSNWSRILASRWQLQCGLS